MTTTDSTVSIPVRLDFDAHAAGFYRAMTQLDRAATKELDAVDFDPKLRELVRIRASHLNGCAYCIDMHTKDARAIGESEQRLYALPAWEEAPFFTPRERAALAPTGTVTRGAGTPGARRAVILESRHRWQDAGWKASSGSWGSTPRFRQPTSTWARRSTTRWA